MVALAHDLFSSWTADWLGLANTLSLPAPDGNCTAHLPGQYKLFLTIILLRVVSGRPASLKGIDR